jgi:hypothetical protein
MASLIGLPQLEAVFQNDGGGGGISLRQIKVANALVYALSLYVVQQPGRLDGSSTDVENKQKTMNSLFPNNRDRSLVFPSGWAFVIWAFIFLGELVFCTSSLWINETESVALAIKKASPGFLTGQIFQMLWAMSFRPKYDRDHFRFVAPAMLSGIAWSMNRAHAGFTLVSEKYNLRQYLLYFFPMSLHFGWTLAAALLNWNGSFAAPINVSPVWLACVGHVSAIAATAVGIGVTVVRRAPVVGIVVAWALTACSTGMQERLTKANVLVGKDDRKHGFPQMAGLYGARVQKWLCIVGAGLSAGTAIAIALNP